MSWVKAVTSKDDVFDEDTDDISLQNKEWRCIMEKRTKDGFRDGIDAGKEASLQLGFNLGYREGAGKIKAVAQLKGIIRAPGSSALSSVTELLRRVELHEEDLIEAMRRAQEQPPVSVSEVSGDMEELGVGQGDQGCSGTGGDGQAEDADGGSLRIGSPGFAPDEREPGPAPPQLHGGADRTGTSRRAHPSSPAAQMHMSLLWTAHGDGSITPEQPSKMPSVQRKSELLSSKFI